MEYIEGEVLRDVFDDDMDDERGQKVIVQLKQFMTKLHSIKEVFIGSIDGCA